jgi:hypothetical protein
MNRLSAPVIASIVACAIILLVAITGLPPVLSAFVTAAEGHSDLESAVATLVERHDQSRQQNQDRFIGRSLFYKPPSPPRDPTPPPPAREPSVEIPPQPPIVPVDTGPPPPPSTYQGPSVMFVVGDTVWFRPMDPDAKELKITKGEEREGVTVLDTSPPWSVRVGFQRGEYDVPLYGKMDETHFTPSTYAAATPGLVDVDVRGEAQESAAAEIDEHADTDPAGDRSEDVSPPPPAPVVNETPAREITVPDEALTQEAVDAMSKGDARSMMLKVAKARTEARDDPELYERLSKDFDLLSGRLKQPQ